MKRILYIDQLSDKSDLDEKGAKGVKGAKSKKVCKSANLILSKRVNVHLKKKKWILPDAVEFQTFLNDFNSTYIQYVRETSMPTSTDVNIQEHQKYVAHFLKEETPYRGLLLFHGLGSGKTMASINIAEGYSSRQSIIMTPASLRSNFKMEIDQFSHFHSQYHKNKHWCKITKSFIQKKVLEPGIMSEEQYNICKLVNGGIWLASTRGEPNWDSLKESHKNQISYCYTKLFEFNYKFSHYNGSNQLQKILKEIFNREEYSALINDIKTQEVSINRKEMSIDRSEQLNLDELRGLVRRMKDPNSEIKNPFDHKMVIIDEVHNFITKIINGSKQCYFLYELMLSAEDMRIVCLSGTPAINTPFELSVLFNLIRGEIDRFSFPLLKSLNSTKECKHELQKIGCLRINIQDDIIRVTRVPYGFEQVLEDDVLSVRKMDFVSATWISDSVFCKKVESVIEKNSGILKPNIKDEERHSVTTIFPCIVNKNESVKMKQHIVDMNDIFMDQYIKQDERESKLALIAFKGKIAGLVSHYHGANPDDPQSYFPELINKNESGIPVELSDYQFQLYTQNRAKEQKLEQKSNVSSVEDAQTASYYKVLSRQALLFCFPPFSKKGDVLRRPRKSEISLELRIRSMTSTVNNQESIDADFTLNPKKAVQDEYDNRITETMKKVSTYNFMNTNVKDQYDQYDKLQTYKEIYKEILYNFPELYEKRDGRMIKEKIEEKSGVAMTFKLLRSIETEINAGKEDDPQEESEIEQLNDLMIEPLRSKNHSAVWNTVDVAPNQTFTKYSELLSIYYPLRILSPKCDLIFKNMMKSTGLVFCYSQFRNVEGIEVFARILLAHGFAKYDSIESRQKLGLNDACRYKIIVDENEIWKTGQIIDMDEEKYFILREMDKDKNKIDEVKRNSVFRACFALWTGTEDIEKKNELLIVFNDSDVAKQEKYLRNQHISKTKILLQMKHENKSGTETLVEELRTIEEKLQNFYEKRENKHGEKISILFTTQSGSEGISLMGVRQVHLFEPYWNKIRETQVIGRARRKYSHYHLPKDEQNVEVFTYVSTFSSIQKGIGRESWFTEKEPSYLVVTFQNMSMVSNIDSSLVAYNKKSKRMMANLRSIAEKDDYLTSDEILRNNAMKKFNIISIFLKCIKEACIDCTKNLTVNQSGEKETIQCVQQTFVERDNYAFEYQDSTVENLSLDYLQKEIHENIIVIRETNRLLNNSYRFIINREKNEMYDFYIYEGYDETEDRGTTVKIGKIDGGDNVFFANLKSAYIRKGDIFENLIAKFPHKKNNEIFIEYKRQIMEPEKTISLPDDDEVMKLAASLGLLQIGNSLL